MATKTSIIYSPAGKAGEYSKLAANLYQGCDHACKYCYAPAATRKSYEQFIIPKPRDGIIRKFADDCNKLRGNRDGVLLSFTCDPYQKIDEKYKLTRTAIALMNDNDIAYTILTKGGNRSRRDFDLLCERPDLATYAATLVFTDESQREIYEPGAASTSERIECLRDVHEMGIKTWVSLEPVYDPVQAIEIINTTHEFVDLFKVGKLNYQADARDVNWSEFANTVVSTLENIGANYYIKEDLKKYL